MTPGRPSIANLKAKFLTTFPGHPWRSPHYPTRDRVIPAEEFDVLILQLDSVTAERQVTGANAYALGRAITHAKSSYDAERAVEPVRERAYPLLHAAPLADAPLCLPAHLRDVPRAPDAPDATEG